MSDDAAIAEYRTSEAVNEIFAALAKAQGEIKNAAKDAVNPHFKTKYAGLASIAEACRAALSKHGIAVLQIPHNVGKDVGVATVLGHSSGQWISGTISVAPAKWDAQGVGSVLTYLRRYSLAAMAGVAPADDDDDGEAAADTRASFSPPAGRPTTNGATRTAAPRQAEPPAHAAASNGNGGRPKWISDFLARPKYEIEPAKAGGWSAWEKAYGSVADHADDIDQLWKLENDNAEHFPGFRESVQKLVYEAFRARIDANEKRLWRTPDPVSLAV